MKIRIIPAVPADVPELLAMIRELADFEELSHLVECDEEKLTWALFSPTPCAEALLVRDELTNEALAYAVCFTTFSTFLGKPGLWLEDIYVRPAFRKQGIAKRVLAHIAKLALARGYRRFEWSVLDWNTPAQNFYTSIGATVMPDWRITRLVDQKLIHFAAEHQ